MVEIIQKKNELTKKTEGTTDELLVTPDAIEFVRTANTGNYDSLKLGGIYKITKSNPTQADIQAAKITIIKDIQNDIDNYINEGINGQHPDFNTSTERTLKRTKEELDRFKKFLSKEHQSEEEQELLKQQAKAQIKAIAPLISNIHNLTFDINDNLQTLFDRQDKILQHYNFTKKDIHLDPYDFPTRMQVTWQKILTTEEKEAYTQNTVKDIQESLKLFLAKHANTLKNDIEFDFEKITKAEAIRCFKIAQDDYEVFAEIENEDKDEDADW
ncbi:MAG: hypothetical protein ACFFCI_00605 [Promethearchaeota archaeon]